MMEAKNALGASIANMAQDWNKQSKLRPFFKEDTPPLKRIKAVTSFYATATVPERVDFNNQHCTQVKFTWTRTYPTTLQCKFHTELPDWFHTLFVKFHTVQRVSRARQ
jgi:hypothetical protein